MTILTVATSWLPAIITAHYTYFGVEAISFIKYEACVHGLVGSHVGCSPGTATTALPVATGKKTARTGGGLHLPALVRQTAIDRASKRLPQRRREKSSSMTRGARASVQGTVSPARTIVGLPGQPAVCHTCSVTACADAANAARTRRAQRIVSCRVCWTTATELCAFACAGWWLCTEPNPSQENG